MDTYDSHFQITRLHSLPNAVLDILNVPLHRTILSLFKKHVNETHLCSTAFVRRIPSFPGHIDTGG